MSRRVALALSLAVSASHCGPPPAVVLADNGRPVPAEMYESMVDRWTREGEVLDWGAGVESRLTVTATYFAKEFRRAYVARISTAGTYPQDERERMLSGSLRAGESEHEFFVALAAQSPRWGDLDRPSSAWRVRLVDDQGREYTPTRIERARQVSALDRAMFHYWTPWRTVFRVRFAATDASGRRVLPDSARHFLLRFSGAYGTLNLRWDVRAP